MLDDRDAAAGLFAGPGEMRARARTHDWAATPLGPAAAWSPTLRTLAPLVMASGFPSALLWGPELTFVYNDAYIALMGAQHPSGLGRRLFDAAPETRETFEPLLARVLAGETVSVADVPTTFRREDPAAPATTSVCTFSFAPVREGGEVAGPVSGIHVQVVETTAQVALRAAEVTLREVARRQAYLLALSDAIRPLADPVTIQAEAMRVLGEHLGVLRAQYWEVDPNDEEYVVSSGGYTTGAPPVTARLRMDDFGASVKEAFRSGRRLIVVDVLTDAGTRDAERASWAGVGVRASVSVLLLKDGRFVAVLGLHHADPHHWTDEEITLAEETAERTWAAVAHARAEMALRESEARFRAVANLVPDLLWESDPDGSTPWYNDRWYEYTGQTPAEAAGWGWIDVIHPDDRARSRAGYTAAVADQRALEQTHRIRRADGAYRWFLVRAEPLRDVGGRVVRWFGEATDVHEERVARDEIGRRVTARTAELAHANARLEREIAARTCAQAERNELLLQLATAQEAERRHLARDLHDEAGQHLAALGLGLQALTDVVPRGSEVDRRVEALRALVDTLGRELHALAVQLRPKALDDFGLEAAVTSYAETWSRRHGIAVAVHARLDAERLAPAVESAVYRIVQEALTNVARHSGATRAAVVVERRDGLVVVTVEDNGCGFDPDAGTPRSSGATSGVPADRLPGGLGLLGIRERATLLGGSVEIESDPGQGTTVFVRIPVDQPPEPIGERTSGARTSGERADGRSDGGHHDV